MSIVNLNDFLVGMAVGIRYRVNFSIEDNLGKIADQILYSNDSFFNPNVFPLAQGNIDNKTLINETTGDKLIINNSNIILDVNLISKYKKEDYNILLNNYKKEIINGVFEKFKLKEINRIGVVKKYLFKEEDIASNFINKTIGNTLKGIDDINLRFSKRLPVSESIIKKDVNDYYNAIFNIFKLTGKKELFMAIDYQRYYDPFLNDVTEIDYDNFINQVELFNNQTFLPWLNKYYLDGK